MDDMAGGAAYNRASSSVLWLGPAEPEEPIEKDGKTMNMRADRKIRILKSRNGVGTGKAVIYQFNDFSFEEIGVADGEQPKPKAKLGAYEKEMAEMANARREAAKKMAKDPSANEDLFT